MSLSFTGDTSSYITTTNPILEIGNSEFTIEWFQYRTDNNSAPRIFQFGAHPATFGVSIENNKLYVWANNLNILNTDIGEHKNQWVHFAITRDANQRFRIIKNGTILKSFLYKPSINNTTTLYIGKEQDKENNSTSFGGYLTNFRFTKKGLYTTNFNKPIAPLFNTPNTVLLLLAHKENILNYTFTSFSITNTTTWNSQTPFSTNVLSLSTNTSQSFSGNKWNDFSSLNTQFTLQNTTIQNDNLVFSRSKSARAVQSTTTTRELTNMTIYGWISLTHTTNNVNVLSIITNRKEGERTHGIHAQGLGSFRLRWNNTLSTIEQETNLMFPNNTWTFFALTVSRSRRRAILYLRNETMNKTYQFANRLAFDTPPIILSNLLIGCNLNTSGNPDRHFNGHMRTLQMFDDVLSPSEIRDQYLFSGRQLGFISLTIPDRYRIKVNYNDPSLFQDDFRECFDKAVEIFENIIEYTHGRRFSTSPYNGIYDLVVDVNMVENNVNNVANARILAYAYVRNGLSIPVRQGVNINRLNYNVFINKITKLNDQNIQAYVSILVHEMLHGIGMLNYTTQLNESDMGWDRFIDNTQAGQSWYFGPDPNDHTKSKAIMAYQKSTGNPYIRRIPVENDFSPSNRYSHWEEGIKDGNIPEHRYYTYPEGTLFHPHLRYELMSGFVEDEMYLTNITTGALEDYGYKIDNTNIYIVDYPSNRHQLPEPPIFNVLTTNQNWTPPPLVNSVEFFVIGGGGGGGGGHDRGGGGGGAAGLYRMGNRRVSQNTSYQVIIGEGGNGSTNTYPTIKETDGDDGQPSSFGDIIAEGGKGGLRSRANNGILGGGGAKQNTYIKATSGSGGGNSDSSTGGSGGGGGGIVGDGATGTSVSGGNGGSGIFLSWNNTIYGRGGNGARGNLNAIGIDALSNRGNGGYGGGAGSNSARNGGKGGSGVVIIRYQKGILNDNVMKYPFLTPLPSNQQLSELGQKLNFFDTINFVELINEQSLTEEASLTSLKQNIKIFNNRLDTNKGFVSATAFSSVLSLDPTVSSLLAVSSVEDKITNITADELQQLKTTNTLLYLMNEPDDVVKLNIDNTTYNLTIIPAGLRVFSTDYALNDAFTLGTTRFIVKFTGSVGLEVQEDDPEPQPEDQAASIEQAPDPPTIPDPEETVPIVEINEEETEDPILQNIIEEETLPFRKTISKKILNNTSNRSLFSFLNNSANRVFPQSNFLPIQPADSSTRLRKLKLESHIQSNLNFA